MAANRSSLRNFLRKMTVTATETNSASGIKTSGPCIQFQVLICPFDARLTRAVTNIFFRIISVTSIVWQASKGAVSKTNYTEEELITFVRKGEVAYFRQLVEKHKSYVYTLAFRVVRSHEDAQEVAQDSFVKAYNNLASFKGDAKFSTWLYRIVFNTAISRKRKKKLVETDIDQARGVADSGAMGATDLMAQAERRKWIGRALELLSEDDAFLITLYYFQELTLEEMERITGFQAGNLKVKLFRARKKLAEHLEGYLHGEISSIT